MRQQIQQNPTPKSSAPCKILRVGFRVGEKWIEERYLRSQKDVSIGQSHINTFMLSEKGLPERFPLFQVKKSRYILHFLENWRGTLQLNGQTYTLSEATSLGVAQPIGFIQPNATCASTPSAQKVQVYQLALPKDAQGRLLLDQSTVLFQLVTPPAICQQAHIPKVTKSTYKSTEWLFALALLISFIGHLGLIHWSYVVGPIPEPVQDNLPIQFPLKNQLPKPKRTDITFHWTPAQPPKPRQKVTQSKPKKTQKNNKKKRSRKRRKKRRVWKRPKPTKKPIAKKSTTTHNTVKKQPVQKPETAPNPTPNNRRQKMRARVASTGLLGLLSGASKGSAGKLLKNSKGLERTFARALQGTTPSQVAQATAQSKRRVAKPTKVHSNPGFCKTLQRRALRKGSSLRESSTDYYTNPHRPFPLGKWLALHKDELRSCYEFKIREKQPLQGKIQLLVRVHTSGQAHVQIKKDTVGQGVAQCLQRTISCLSFPKPKSKIQSLYIPFVFNP